MQHTFGLIIPGSIINSIVHSNLVVRLCGSLPELGSWSVEKAPKLDLLTKEFYRSVKLFNEPHFYRLNIHLSKTIHEFHYKYILNDEIWEGKNETFRLWSRNTSKYLVNGIYYTPIDYWADVETGEINEKMHTGNFYSEIVTHKIMHYSCVNGKLYVGSCPRLPTHIENELRQTLGITAVINLQVVKDIERNCQEILGVNYKSETNNEYDLSPVDILRKVYEKSGMLLMWIPITDFSSIGRELMSPQATLVLKTLLEKGHKVYVHCNAGMFTVIEGVGRAFGLVCAYYYFVLKIPLSKIPYDLMPIRSCGYFDRTFLENAETVYKKGFE